MGAVLQQMYVEYIVQFYDLEPSIFSNATVETFCEVFEICRSPSIETTTVVVTNESITNKTFTTESSNSFTLQWLLNPTFGATPFDGGYPNPSLHDSVELGLDVKLWVFRLNALKLYGH